MIIFLLSIMLTELVAEFVKTLNSLIPYVNTNNKKEIELIQKLKDKIKNVMHMCEKSEEILFSSLLKIEENEKECKDIVYIRKDMNIKAIVSRDVLKPVIRPVEKLEVDCMCLFNEFAPFEDKKGYMIVETEEMLKEIDNKLENVVIAVFDHDYRSFEGFTCFISIYTEFGHIYIIDAIKYRDILPKLRLFTCQVKKIFSSQKDVERIIKDFGCIGCYQNFDIPESKVFVDWRIRPLNDILCYIICSTMIDTVEKVNNRIVTERHFPGPIEEGLAFIEKYNIGESLQNVTNDLLKLRNYLGKQYNEGLQYIITDNQLYSVIINMPRTISEFEVLFPRMSSVLRLHVSDFLLVINKKPKGFSIENLKSKKTEFQTEGSEDCIYKDRHKNFGLNQEPDTTEEIAISSSFEISE